MGGLIDGIRAQATQILAGVLGVATLGLLIAMLIAQADARHWRAQFAGEQDRHRLTIAEFKRATAEAKAADLAHVAAVQTRDATIAKEAQHGIETRLADTLAIAARYAERMRATATRADKGSGGTTGMPTPANSAGDPAGGAGFAVVPVADLEICTRNTVIAQGWQAWWLEVSGVGR